MYYNDADDTCRHPWIEQLLFTFTWIPWFCNLVLYLFQNEIIIDICSNYMHNRLGNVLHPCSESIYMYVCGDGYITRHCLCCSYVQALCMMLMACMKSILSMYQYVMQCNAVQSGRTVSTEMSAGTDLCMLHQCVLTCVEHMLQFQLWDWALSELDWECISTVRDIWSVFW